MVRRRPGAAETLGAGPPTRRFAPDVAFDFFCNPRTALWTFASGAPRAGRLSGQGLALGALHPSRRPRTLSAVGFHLASVARHSAGPRRMSVPRLSIDAEARAEAACALERRGRSGGRAVARLPSRRALADAALAPASASWRSRARFLARRCREGSRWSPDGPARSRAGAEVAAGLPAGRAHAISGWPLERFVALQARCAAFVCGDTGPMHTAVAPGTPTLGLMSRNRPATFFPYPEAHGHRAYYARVECSPCDRDACDDLRCLERLTVDGAWALLARMLERAPAERRGCDTLRRDFG